MRTGRPTSVVATLATITNGMGIGLWDVAVLGGRPNAEPQTTGTKDYSSDGSWVRLPGDARCYFLATDWHYLSIDRRGSGVYFIGALRPYVGGVLVDSSLPLIRVRRLLRGFAAARSQINPLAWLLAPAATTIRWDDPRLAATPAWWRPPGR